MAFSILYWLNYVSGTKKLHQRSELAVKADHVLKFSFDPELNHVQGRVQASMRDRSYHVGITLGDNYTVNHAICDCVNGLDKCHHKASLLLYGYKNVSKTDLRASWIQHPKRAPPKRTTTMEELFSTPTTFSQLQLGKVRLHSQKPICSIRATTRPVNETDVDFLHDKLNALGQFSATLWIISKEPPSPTLDVPCIEDLLISEAYMGSTDRMKWLKTNLTIPREKIQQVAQMTSGQRENHLWALVRKNRLTASNFGKVLAAIRRNRFPPSLFKQILASYDLSTKDAILWGVNNESVAKAKYCSYGDAVVEETRVWLHESGVLGASPDGIIRRAASYNYNHQVAELSDILEAMQLRPDILEVKCPFTARNMTIPEAIESIKEFCLEYQIHDGRRIYKLKEDHVNYDQVQGQLHILNKSACDFVVWTTKDIAIVRILQDSMWGQNIGKLIDFYFSHIIPIIQK